MRHAYWILLLLFALGLGAQQDAGELRLVVTDAAGLPLSAALEITSRATDTRISARTGDDGRYTARSLPLGVYHVRVTHPGFAPASEVFALRSPVPVERRVALGVAPLEATVTVADASTLLDPHRTGVVFHIGAETLDERKAVQPSRAVLDLVQMQPGWLLEANGVLHPRGSEYQTQYVIDGIPIQDNRSPGIAPALEAEDLESMRVFTANYPAEYGRKLGGVVELQTPRASAQGGKGKLILQPGSFGALHGYVSGQYFTGRDLVVGSAQAARTDRYLDPPVEENFTNRASHSSLSGRWERDWTQNSRLRLGLFRRQAAFLVPNEREQQEKMQRQDRQNEETMFQASYQHVLGTSAVASIRGMLRDLAARLWSNPFSTPIIAGQDRGFGDGYVAASVAWQYGRHDLKAGFDALITSIREEFAYRITAPDFFDDGLAPQFRFAGQRRGNEQAVFLQDVIRAGDVTLSAGLRVDRYRLLLEDTAISPRLGVAWHLPGAGLVLRAAYDRTFETPAFENLLLASSEAARRLSQETSGLPVPPSRGHFYQVGFAKSLFGKGKLDGAVFRRRIVNYADDDVFLNTGVSFPVSFAEAEVQGVEAKLELPRWSIFSGHVSWSNLSGVGHLPLTGGLFLEEEAADLLRSTDSFRISQDQRNTLTGRLRAQIHPRAWLAVSSWYGSGLPFEGAHDGSDKGEEEVHSAAVLERVNFERGRVRPSWSLDLSGGVDFPMADGKSLRLQVDVLNVTNRLNLINFAGIFSGTAIGLPRAYTLRLLLEF